MPKWAGMSLLHARTRLSVRRVLCDRECFDKQNWWRKLDSRTNRLHLWTRSESSRMSAGGRPLPLVPDILTGIAELAAERERSGSTRGVAYFSSRAVQGALTALFYRWSTGEGQQVDVSIQESVVQATEHITAGWDRRKTIQKRGEESGFRQSQLWPCKDGFISFAYSGGVRAARTTSAFVEWMASEGLEDESFKNFDWGKLNPMGDKVPDKLVCPYFEAVASWYGHVGIGVTGGELYRLIHDSIGDPFFGVSLNPGHLIHLEEWVNSPVYEGSTERLRSGMALQVDVIPATNTPYFTTNIEDGIALANEGLRTEFASKYPEAWERIGSRRAFMEEELGISLKPEVLPFSNIPAYLPPFLLSPHRAMKLVRD